MKSYIKVPQIFISYRRDDSAGYAGRIYDRLTSHFGADRVFMDVDDIKPGDDFVKVLDESEKNCAALVVVIGRIWSSVRSAKNGLRLFDPQDFVRREIAAGLKNNVRLFPVLVGGAAMPEVADLPDELAPLAHVQAVTIHDAAFQRDMDQLMTALDDIVSKSAPPAHFDGKWTATIQYGWGDTHEEVFEFEVDGDELLGTASFLTAPRAVLEGKINGPKVTFLTKTLGMLGSETFEMKHQYSGKLVDNQINFRMLTEGGYDTNLPVKFVAARDAGDKVS